jgi:hypothetical protein
MNYQLYGSIIIPFVIVGSIAFAFKDKKYDTTESECLKTLVWLVR